MNFLIKIAAICVFSMMMSGCVYRVVEQPVQEKQQPSNQTNVQKDVPTSYSYPVPPTPYQINNYISNQPLKINDNQDMIVEKSSNQQDISGQYQQSQDSVSVVSPESDQSNIDNERQQQTAGSADTASAPVGSFDNPISYKQ